MGKLITVAAAVAAKLTLIESATISAKFCNLLRLSKPSSRKKNGRRRGVFALQDRGHSVFQGTDF
jgi:hypothetical protein